MDKKLYKKVISMNQKCEFLQFDMSKVDFHSHILPGIDDGARTVEESLSLIGEAKNNDIELIVATPHFYAHKINLDEFFQNRENSYKILMEKYPDVSIILGAEVLVFPGLENMDGIEKLSFGEEKILLLEMPLSESLIYDDYFLTVEELAKRFKIVMAHANRYSDRTVVKMIEAGALLQLNVEDVCCRRERKRIEQWLYEDLIFALGSDAHRNPKVYKKYKKTVKILDKIKKVLSKD